MQPRLKDIEIIKPDVLVLGPGDYQCLLPLGVCLFLDNKKYLNNVNYYIGVDSGAILSLLLIVGFNPVEASIKMLNFNPLNQEFDPSNFIFKHGLVDQEYIIIFLNKIIRNKLGFIPNLKQLYNISKKEVTFVVSRIDSGVEYINYQNYPEMSCVTAAVMSYCKPMIFTKMRYNQVEYTGGILDDPYPLNYFNDDKRKILGIFASPKHHSKYKILQYVNSILNKPIMSIFNLVSQNAGDNCSSIFISSDKIDLLTNATSLDDKFQILYSGFKTGQKYYSDRYEIYENVEIDYTDQEDNFI